MFGNTNRKEVVMNGRSGWARAVVVVVIVSWAGQGPASAAFPGNSSDPVIRWPYGPVDAVAEAGGQLFFGSGCVLTIANVSGVETPRVVAIDDADPHPSTLQEGNPS